MLPTKVCHGWAQAALVSFDQQTPKLSCRKFERFCLFVSHFAVKYYIGETIKIYVYDGQTVNDFNLNIFSMLRKCTLGQNGIQFSKSSSVKWFLGSKFRENIRFKKIVSGRKCSDRLWQIMLGLITFFIGFCILSDIKGKLLFHFFELWLQFNIGDIYY